MRNTESVSCLLNWSSLFSTVHHMSDRLEDLRRNSRRQISDEHIERERGEFVTASDLVTFVSSLIKVHLAYRNFFIANGFGFKGLNVIKN